MKRFLCGALAGLLAVVSLALAGGFPSRPFFQSVGVGQQAPATAGQLQTTGNATIGGSLIVPNAAIESMGNVSTASLGISTTGVFLLGGNSASVNIINSAAGTDDKIWQYFADSSGVFHLGTINDAANTAQDALDISRSGTSILAVNFPSGALESAGVPVPVYSVTVTTNPSSCSILTQPGLEYSACTRVSTGLYHLTIINRTVAPICSVTSWQGAGPVSLQSVTATQVSWEAFTFAGALVDNTEVSIHCSYQ